MITHLHVHSYYSFLIGIPSPVQLAEAAKKVGFTSLAMTDRHCLTGAVEFFEACQNVNIKPIIGLELKVNHHLGSGDLVLLAIDQTGWKNLCRISSQIQTDPHRDPESGLDFEELVIDCDGLICLTGGQNGILHISQDLNQYSQNLRLLGHLKAVFPERLYIELFDPSQATQLTDLAEKAGLPTVAVNPTFCIDPKQVALLNTLTAIRRNIQLTRLPSESFRTKDAILLSLEDFYSRFREYPAALANTQKITECCNWDLPLGQPHYPEIPLIPNNNADSQLQTLSEEGATKRYGKITPEIRERLDHELEIIAARGYAPLFLIVQEILSYATSKGIPFSSRGSAASSLVAYCLGITSPDPLALNLYFERFLNPARVTPPDIDTDLCSERRDEVLKYVYDKYGEDRVAMVATINRFRPRSALREVAKAYGLSSKEISDLVEDIPYRGWAPSSRKKERSTIFRDQNQFSSQNAHIYRDAEAILGFPRHLSIHPGGIVISPVPLMELLPTYLASKGIVITQFDLNSVEKMGLVKIDLLGTRGLTVLGDVAEKIHAWNRREYHNPLDVLDSIPTDDPETASLVKSARTIGCFQIESPGMRSTLKEIDAQSQEDLMIALALYRPGPMTGGLKRSFVMRHLGEEQVEHLHPSLAPLLEDTYGVILYQEQVLLIASQIAGLSLADADLLRRAMSHFDPGDRMKTLRERFLRGAERKSSVPMETAENIWELMAAFAGYGFPKAHAASYAQVSWRSAWCKAHYPAEFIAAVLAGWGGYYRQIVYLNEARRLGLSLHPPHVNQAQRQFSVTYPKGIPKLYMGLNQVRDLTRRTQNRILLHRPFHGIEEFLLKVDPRPNEAENLIKVGALDGFGSIPDLLSRIHQGGWAYGQPPLLVVNFKTDRPDWERSQRMMAQRSILGAGLDAHPVELVADQVAQIGAITSLEALSRPDEDVIVAGVRQSVQRFYAHQGDPFYILELEDLEGVLPVLMPPNFYRKNRKLMGSLEPFAIEGKMVVLQMTGEYVMQVRKIVPLV